MTHQYKFPELADRLQSDISYYGIDNMVKTLADICSQQHKIFVENSELDRTEAWSHYTKYLENMQF